MVRVAGLAGRHHNGPSRRFSLLLDYLMGLVQGRDNLKSLGPLADVTRPFLHSETNEYSYGTLLYINKYIGTHC